MSKILLGLASSMLLIAILPATASAKTAIRTKIISRGEVSIMDVYARDDGQSVTVSGTGFEVFPNRTCGYPEIDFVNSKGRILFRKDGRYVISELAYRNSRPSLTEETRYVKFSVTVPVSAPVALVVVSHHSTGGCEHAWSLTYALDWLIEKIFSPHR